MTRGKTFPELVNRAAYGKERTIVSRRGKDLAAVISIDDLHLLERLVREEMDRIDLEDARASLAEADEKGTIPLRPPEAGSSHPKAGEPGHSLPGRESASSWSGAD